VLWIRFDVFAQFTVQFALLCLAAAIGIAMPRFKALVTAAIFVALLAGYGLWPYLATAGAEKSLMANEKRLRVMQFNVHAGALNAREALATIKLLDPDIISLVEIDNANKPLLEALKANYPYQATCWQIRGCETAILSRLALTTPTSQADWEGADYIMTTLGPEFGNLRLVSSHTTRFPFARAQLMQVQFLATTLQGGAPLIVMGDFNATPFSRVTIVFAESLGLQMQTYLPSWPADKLMPQLAIDHIFTSPGIRALDHEVVGPASGSDHLPVAITLAIATH